jgi:hypothetical protein
MRLFAMTPAGGAGIVRPGQKTAARTDRNGGMGLRHDGPG